VKNPEKNIDAVVKRYDNAEVSKENLRYYYGDTAIARQILLENPNPLKQSVNIDGQDFALEYEIVEQGGIILNDNMSIEGTEPENGKKAVLGQKFVAGQNFIDLTFKDINNDEIDPNQKIFFDQEDITHKIQIFTRDLFSYLSRELEVDFDFYGSNAKPFLDLERKRIKVFITDLGGNLKNSYPD
jgi:hypothetical protein